MQTEIMKHQPTKRSILPHFSGEIYTKYLAWFYDAATHFTGWKRKTALYALSGVKPCRMLDVGCGTGYLMDQARKLGFEVAGIDPSTGMLEKARVKFGFSKKEMIVSTACRLPFPDASFDFLLASGSMAYVPNMAEAATEMARVTKKGGIIRVIEHARPLQKNLFTALMHIFTHASGDLIHDYEFYFSKHGRMSQHKTLGRGGFMQMFDFEKK